MGIPGFISSFSCGCCLTTWFPEELCRRATTHPTLMRKGLGRLPSFFVVEAPLLSSLVCGMEVTVFVESFCVVRCGVLSAEGRFLILLGLDGRLARAVVDRFALLLPGLSSSWKRRLPPLARALDDVLLLGGGPCTTVLLMVGLIVVVSNDQCRKKDTRMASCVCNSRRQLVRESLPPALIVSFQNNQRNQNTNDERARTMKRSWHDKDTLHGQSLGSKVIFFVEEARELLSKS